MEEFKNQYINIYLAAFKHFFVFLVNFSLNLHVRLIYKLYEVVARVFSVIDKHKKCFQYPLNQQLRYPFVYSHLCYLE